MFCRSLFVLLSFFCWPLCCLFFSVDHCVVCSSVFFCWPLCCLFFCLFLLAIVLSVLLRFTDSGIFKLLFHKRITSSKKLIYFFQKRVVLTILHFYVNESGVVMVLKCIFNTSGISWRLVLLVEEIGENHRPVASH